MKGAEIISSVKQLSDAKILGVTEQLEKTGGRHLANVIGAVCLGKIVNTQNSEKFREQFEKRLKNIITGKKETVFGRILKYVSS